MHINTVKVGNYWVRFDLEYSENKNSIQPVAIFIKDGNEIHKIYNIGTSYSFPRFDYCAKLLDSDFAKKEAERMIGEANRSAHIPFN